jgi:hypothetical protein
VAIYLNVLEELARRKKFNIYVQPVAPVRHIIPLCPTALHVSAPTPSSPYVSLTYSSSGVE